MRSPSKHRRSLREVAARSVVWALCMGFSKPDAKRLHLDTSAAIAEAVARGESSLDELLGVVWRTLGSAVRDPGRWDLHRAVQVIMDVPFKAVTVALLGAVCIGFPLGVLAGSLHVGALACALAAVAVLFVRGVRGFRRAIYRIDPAHWEYRARMARNTARLLTVPNVISVLRVPAAVVVGLLLSQGAAWFAFILLAFIVASDSADGVIARHWDQETTLGERLDPAVDRITVVIVATSIIVLEPGLPGGVRALLVAVALRDVLLLSGGLIVVLGDRALPSRSIPGKGASILEFGGLALALLIVATGPPRHTWLEIAAACVLAGAVVLGLGSIARHGAVLHRQPPVEAQRVPVADADPYSHLGVLHLLDGNPFSATLAWVYVVLLGRMWEGHSESTSSPLELVDSEIARIRRRLEEAGPYAGEELDREWLLNLRMLRTEIERFQG